MNCKRVHAWLSEEIDGQLAPEAVPRLEEHLAACPACREYRQNLAFGGRLLRATTVEPPAGFEWRLQLKLNQTLKAAAAEASAPWPTGAPGWRPWLGHFGVSASVGLAAVLTAALFVASEPTSRPAATVAQRETIDSRVPVSTTSVATTDRGLFSGSRRPLTASEGVGGGFMRTVSGSRDRGLAGRETWLDPGAHDLLSIQRVQQQNAVLKRRLAAAEYRCQVLEARLDSVSRRP